MCAAHRHTLACAPDTFETGTESQEAPCILACVAVTTRHIKKKKNSLYPLEAAVRL